MVAAFDTNEEHTPGEPTPGMSASRLAQLRADMLLTPEERVLAAEATLTLDRVLRPNVPRVVVGFDRYEDFLDYQESHRIRE